MNGYQPRHAKHADPDDLPEIFRGLANLIVVIPSQDSSE